MYASMYCDAVRYNVMQCNVCTYVCMACMSVCMYVM